MSPVNVAATSANSTAGQSTCYSPKVERASIGLGGNVGDVADRLRWAANELARLPGVAAVRLSSLWRGAPVGPISDQPWFVNSVVELTGSLLPPRELLAALHEIEARAGRDRAEELQQGPRTLDLDLLLHGDTVLNEDGITLPHPRVHLRAFALAPLVELHGPDLVIPGAGTAGELLAQASAQRIVWIG